MEQHPTAWPKKSYLALAILFTGLLTTCSLPDIPLAAPAEIEVVDPPCVSIPRAPNLIGYNYQIPDGTIWYSGCYNPNDANEAAVVVDLPDRTMSGMYRMDLRTGQRTPILTQGEVSYQLDWSRTGWILLRRNREAWKIRPNGDSLTQITSTNGALTAAEAWSPDGKFILCRRTAADYAQTGLAIYTDRGTFVRLLPDARTRAYDFMGWSPDGRRLAYTGAPNSPVTEPRLCIYDLTTDRLDTLDVLPRSATGLSGVRWLPNGNEVVWSARTGVAITNLQTRRTRYLRTACPGAVFNRGFGLPSPSPDGQKILLARGDFAVSPADPNLLIEKHCLETMSVQGGQIRKVTP